MYIKQNNPVALRSQHMIADALTRLMEKKSFSDITVTEICTEADVGRKTFYRNFERKEDVIVFQLDELYDQYAKKMATLTHHNKLPFHFRFIFEHRDYMRLLEKNNMLSLMKDKFHAYIYDRTPCFSENPVEQEYFTNFFLASITASTVTWAKRNFAESIDQIVAFTVKMLELLPIKDPAIK